MNDFFSWKLYFSYKFFNCQGRVWGHWLCHSHTHIKNHYRTPKSALKFFRLLAHSISFLSQKGVRKINFLVQVGKSKSLAKHHIPCTVVAPVFQPNHLNMTYHHHHHHCRATLSRPHYSKAGHVESSSGAPNTPLWWSETIVAPNNVQQRSGWKEEFVLEVGKQWGRQWWAAHHTSDWSSRCRTTWP